MWAIYKRELRSYFITPIGYIFAGMFIAVSGALFAYTTLLTQSSAGLYTYFVLLLLVFCVLLPLLTMKLFSEERKSRTEQILLTSPVTLAGIVTAKFLAALTIFACSLAVNSFNFTLSLRQSQSGSYSDQYPRTVPCGSGVHRAGTFPFRSY